MFCPKCGVQNPDNATSCNQCNYPFQNLGGTPPRRTQGGFYQDQPGPGGAPQPGMPGPPPSVPNHLVWAILTTILCCLPFGVVAIVYAASVSGKLQKGDYAGALDASNKAKIWSWVSFGAGLVITILSVMLGILGAVMEGSY